MRIVCFSSSFCHCKLIFTGKERELTDRPAPSPPTNLLICLHLLYLKTWRGGTIVLTALEATPKQEQRKRRSQQQHVVVAAERQGEGQALRTPLRNPLPPSHTQSDLFQEIYCI